MYTTDCLWCVFFFFKQKTAYEMRISDWSSDVCSSDLVDAARRPHRADPVAVHGDETVRPRRFRSLSRPPPRNAGRPAAAPCDRGPARKLPRPGLRRPRPRAEYGHRSEEHTSELQSLMRSSYAVFCLKKKNNIQYHNTKPGTHVCMTQNI